MRAKLVPVVVLAVCLGLSACQRSDNPPADKGSGGGVDFFPAQPSPKPLGRFSPRNDCIALPNAKPFFLAFEKAVKDRNADALLNLTDPNVKLDFGGGSGVASFRERLADKQGALWNALDKLTTLGCAKGPGGTMIMPWYAGQSMNDVDTNKALIVIGANVPLQQQPNTSAPTLGTVSWDAVTLMGNYDSNADYLQVKTADGKVGYIASDKLRSPLDYRLVIVPAGDKWRIASFVRGD